MKAAILIESLTGNTWKAGELIAANLQQENWSITGISSMKDPNHASIQDADTVIVAHGFTDCLLLVRRHGQLIVCVIFQQWLASKQLHFARMH